MPTHNTYLKIDLDTLQSNFEAIRQTAGVPVMAVVKANAYGHGAIAVAIILARELVVSGFRMVAASKGAVIAADKSGKIKTFVQDIAIAILLVGAQFTTCSVINLIGLILLAIATILTIVSGVECIVKNKAVLKDN